MRSLVSSREARLFLLAQFLTPLSEGTFGLTSLIYVAKSTSTTLALGVLLMITMLPSFVLAPFAGVLIDRLDRATLATIGTGARLLAVLGIVGTSALPGAPIWLFYGLVGFYYLFWYLTVPNTDSLLRQILTPEQYVAGSSVTQGVYQTGLILSTVVAGAIVTSWGTTPAFVLVAVVVVASGICYAVLSRSTAPVAAAAVAAAETPAAAKRGLRGYFADLRSGFAYVLHDRGTLIYCLAGAMVLPTYQAINVLIAPFVFGPLHGTSFSLGLIDSAAGLGAIAAAALCVAAEKRMRSVAGVLTASIFLLAASVAGFANVRSVAMAFVVYFLVGIFVGNMKVLVRALLYARVDPAFIGRTMSAMSMGNLALGIVFALAAGSLGTHGLALAYYALVGSLIVPALLLLAYMLAQSRGTVAPAPHVAADAPQS